MTYFYFIGYTYNTFSPNSDNVFFFFFLQIPLLLGLHLKNWTPCIKKWLIGMFDW